MKKKKRQERETPEDISQRDTASDKVFFHLLSAKRLKFNTFHTFSSHPPRSGRLLLLADNPPLAGE